MVQAQSLFINKIVSSETNGNTVEYNCIDESLTGKCIKYHNDQWYLFESGDYKKLYINVAQQNCRDLFGVQLVIIKGELCSPETYSIVDCISLATQDDIYVELESLEPNTLYWLNVDGYLHDFCTFNLEISDTPKGQSEKQFNQLLKQNSISKNGTLVQLSWEIPDSLAFQLEYFQILRRASREFKFQPTAQVELAYNSYGKSQLVYTANDTLFEPDTYYYRIVAVDKNKQQRMLNEQSITASESEFQKIVLPLDYNRGTSLTLKIFGEGRLLQEQKFTYNPIQHAYYKLFTDSFRHKNLKVLEARVINSRDNHTKTYFINLETGQVYSP